MIIYHANDERFGVNRHEIVAAVFDSDAYKFDESELSPHGTLTIDEVTELNRTRCQDVFNHVGFIDVSGRGKYFVNTALPAPRLFERSPWVRRPTFP